MTKLKNIDPKPQFLQTAVSGSRFVPMLFSTDIVKAILNGTKTETRRVVKFPKLFDGKEVFDNLPNGLKYSFEDLLFRMESPVKVNNIIWVRETFCNDERGSESGEDDCFYYKADLADDIWLGSWKPSLFMPKKACRIFLKVVSVSVERLKDIDEQGAINEGIENLSADEFKYNLFKNYLRSDKEANYQDFTTDNPIWSYQTLWQKINGKDSWDLNPFVFVYKFQRIDQPHGFR